MLEREQDHVAAGRDDGLRWIEAGRLRLEENSKSGAQVMIQTTARSVHLSATELLGLVGHLSSWFADDPTDMIRQIETHATHVQTELEKWNARARIDEEHPPYDKLTLVLDELIGKCRELREVVGRFTEVENDV
jgi:hypothetical protein